MRVQHWIAPALGLMLALANSRDALAQYNSDPYEAAGSATAHVEPASHMDHQDNGLPSYYDQALVAPDAYGGYPPAYTQVAPYPFDGGNGYGPTVQPWPTISPYETAFSQHTNDGGLWHQATNGFGKKWFSTFEYLSTRTKRPEGVLGDTSSQPYWTQVFRDQFSQIPGGGGGTGDDDDDTSSGAEILQNTNYYNRLDLKNMSDIMGKGGRTTVGFWNPDDSGFKADFWFTGNSREVFDARKHDATKVQTDLDELVELLGGDEFFFAADLGLSNLFDVLEGNLLNLRGLPVNDGSESGITIPYDLYFQVETRSQNIGAGLSHYLTPIYKTKYLQVNPSVGARYLMIDEGFNFVGVDSGMLYMPDTDAEIPIRDMKSQSVPNGVDDNGDGIIDNAGIIEEGGEGGGGGGTTVQEATFFFPFPNSEMALTKAFIDVDTMTHLVGPEVGLRYDMGGDKFKLSGETKLGLMVNNEKIKLRGDNIGSITRTAFLGREVTIPGVDVINTGDDDDDDDDVTFIENDPGLFVPTAENPHPNAFQDEEDHTHFSPLFEQSLFADMNVFGYVPVLKDIYLFENAKFRFGYTFLWANEIVTTNQSVVYDGKPTANLFPHIKLKRETWWTSNYSFGVSWDF